MRKKRGPEPEVLKIDGNWKDAMAKMLRGGGSAPSATKPKAKRTKRKG